MVKTIVMLEIIIRCNRNPVHPVETTLKVYAAISILGTGAAGTYHLRFFGAPGTGLSWRRVSGLSRFLIWDCRTKEHSQGFKKQSALSNDPRTSRRNKCAANRGFGQRCFLSPPRFKSAVV